MRQKHLRGYTLHLLERITQVDVGGGFNTALYTHNYTHCSSPVQLYKSLCALIRLVLYEGLADAQSVAAAFPG